MPATPPAKGPARRRVSGRLADSTRSTVAPCSARYLVVIGPTATQQKSRTFSPARGKGVVVIAAPRRPGYRRRLLCRFRAGLSVRIPPEPVCRPVAGLFPYAGESSRGNVDGAAGDGNGVPPQPPFVVGAPATAYRGESGGAQGALNVGFSGLARHRSKKGAGAAA